MLRPARPVEGAAFALGARAARAEKTERTVAKLVNMFDDEVCFDLGWYGRRRAGADAESASIRTGG